MARHYLCVLLLFTCVYVVYVNSSDLKASQSSPHASAVRFSFGRFVICKHDEYRCEGRIPKCVQRSNLCDQHTDCPLGDDETNCSYAIKCTSGTILCANQVTNGNNTNQCVSIADFCQLMFNCTNITPLSDPSICANVSTVANSSMVNTIQPISKLNSLPKIETTSILSTLISSIESNNSVQGPSSTFVSNSGPTKFPGEYSNENNEISAASGFNNLVPTNKPKQVASTSGSKMVFSTYKKPKKHHLLPKPYKPEITLETTTAFTHIEHISEVPAKNFDFQPFFKPFFNMDQMPFGDFIKSNSKDQKSQNGIGSNKFDYMKKFDFSKFMKGNFANSGASSNQSGDQKGSGAPFDYSKYMKSSGSGSFDYSVYMNGKPPKVSTPKSTVKHKYHKADYLKFYEDNSDKSKSKEPHDPNLDFVSIDHRSEKSKVSNQTKLISLSNGQVENSTETETETETGTETVTASSTYDDGGSNQIEHTIDTNQSHSNSNDDANNVDSKSKIPVNKWPAHTIPGQVPDGKGNKVNVSKIIPKTMLNGYSYTHYGSGVFFINFGTIVNGNSNIMGSGNDVGNGNANGNNNGNTQGDNLRSNTNNRNEEATDKS